MELPNLDQQDAIVSLLITIGGLILRAGVKIGKILKTVERLEKDVDGIAEFVGTPRAIATKKARELKETGV